MNTFRTARREVRRAPSSSSRTRSVAHGSDAALIQRALEAPETLTPELILRLNRTLGNAFVQRLLRGEATAVPSIQQASSGVLQRDKETGHVPGVGDIATHSQEDWNKLKQTREGLEDQTYGGRKTAGQLVYRGDTRHWSEIFKTGFTQQSLVGVLESMGFEAEAIVEFIAQAGENAFRMPKISVRGEKVQGGISTTTDESTARRKYGIGGYVYAIHLRSGGYDFRDVNDLEEINSVGIPPEDVIAAVGPISEIRTEEFGPPDGYKAKEIKENPRHTVGSRIAGQAIQALLGGVTIDKSLDDTLM